MYRALYRKWRPRRFDEVTGQEAIITALANQVAAGKVGHAYLFTGTRGTGKTTCAKILAKAVNCENPQDAEPCGVCPCCTGAEDGSILDVVEIDAASNNSVDDVRALREETAYRPSRCKYRVYIIDEVHMLSASAFNALLKIMEEPPPHVIFILATTEIHKVPATVVSRCQRYDFTRIPPHLIAQRLLYIAGEEHIALAPEAAGLIARLADGALRDAISLLDTCSGTGEAVDEALVRRMAGIADRDYLFRVSDAVLAQDTKALLVQVAALRERSVDVRRLAEELVFHFRNFMMALAAPDGSLLDALGEAEQQRYLAGAPAVGEARAIAAVRRLAAAMDRMGRSPEPRIELELALFDLCDAGGEAAGQEAPVSVAAAGPAPHVPPQAPAAPKEDMAGDEQATAAADEKPPLGELQAAAPKAPAQQTTAPPAATAAQPEQPQPFAEWPAVVERMAQTDRMLYSYMKGSQAFLEGRRVLIAGGEMFLTYMREYNEAADRIKTVIEEVTGQRYAIGPYTQPVATGAAPTVQDTLRAWEAMGVPVEYE